MTIQKETEMDTKEMGSSWLVQRLTKPRGGSSVLGKDNPFSFGGGLKNGGLSDDAMDLLRSIFAFDYMGAAEFEFGAVPKTLNKLANSSLVRFSFAVPLAEVPKGWRDKSKTKPKGAAVIYAICPIEYASQVEQRLNEWAREEPRLKEGTRLHSSLRPIEDWDRDVRGWLELDNGFMFFTDVEMYDKTCELFGVGVGV